MLLTTGRGSGRERERVCVCVCVCVREREREGEPIPPRAHPPYNEVWLDVKMDQRDEAAMRRGVENSSAVIALLSASYFDRPFCLKELAWWGCMCKVYVQGVCASASSTPA